MNTDTARRFGGIGRLYGAGSVDRLARAHVCVIGIGGVGSWAAEALARSGVGQITLIDLDHIAESNINRQLHALESTLGMAKAAAMAARIADINPACIVTPVDEFITADNVATLLPECDAVIDAIDSVRAKAALIAHCRQQRQFIVTTGGAGGRRDPTRITLVDLARTTQDALAAKVRARLRKDYGFPRGPKSRFGVDCVYSPEPIRRPVSAEFSTAQACTIPATDDTTFNGAAGLACAGYGSVVTVTASFGLAAAARTLAAILNE